MSKLPKRLSFLDADVKSAGDVVYPEFKPYFSKDGIVDLRPAHHGLFEPEDEELQQSHGRAIWDEFGWSRDKWVF